MPADADTVVLNVTVTDAGVELPDDLADGADPADRLAPELVGRGHRSDAVTVKLGSAREHLDLQPRGTVDVIADVAGYCRRAPARPSTPSIRGGCWTHAPGPSERGGYRRRRDRCATMTSTWWPRRRAGRRRRRGAERDRHRHHRRELPHHLAAGLSSPRHRASTGRRGSRSNAVTVKPAPAAPTPARSRCSTCRGTSTWSPTSPAGSAKGGRGPTAGKLADLCSPSTSRHTGWPSASSLSGGSIDRSDVR